MLRKINVMALSAVLTMAALPAHALSLDGLVGEATKEASNLLTGVSKEAADNPLTSQIAEGLKVNDEQAAGGAGALLAMAYQELGTDQASELTKMVPGLDSLTGAIPGDLGSMLNNMESVNKVFTALGLDPAMVQEYAPMILKFLGNEGASESLLSDLSSLWGQAA
ncbi:hypothetical protein BCT30_12930 [Enterovibrio norvegicus]|uniref:DUF2780 domain-containing protein n=1 Tax=Enterovibrio norvegicus TaxID=188144 RepID=UPI000C84723D|nr:DUF2780 domain-containing protein [Enterovibrio norvegicus]MCC4797477.1 DUF2780 domain-containing protein [Enterovibrio norvegicus]PMI32833.1 hypothetical protein BCU47_11290 [Enterovibrio norvegicus]PMI41687.1 hypothetical protein BCU46_04375 [Enterovibrio norvegicus]PMN52524.1 hypothetical protein BCT30_12930 [Enterovibrio norvegicus]TKF17232.1 DUF2780 domain-containing protein [Enterovibrio norvegicus]